MTAHDISTTKQVLARHRRDLLARPTVHGVGIGFAQSDGDENSIVIKVYVDRHAPDQGIDALPEDLEGIPVEAEVRAISRTLVSEDTALTLSSRSKEYEQ